MRIVFIGTVLFSKAILEKLIELDADIVGVLTKESTKYNSDFCDLSTIARTNRIFTKYIVNVNNKENVDWIKKLNPDIIFCMGISQIIKKEILNIPKLGVLGFHPSALPQNRGRHPIIWALVLGLKETASTFFIMDEGADSGDVISQKTILIEQNDNASDLYKKIEETAKNQVANFLPNLTSGNFKLIEQKEVHSNYWRKRGVKDGLINFNMNALSIYNLVRGLTKPYLGAHIYYKNLEIKIWKVSMGSAKKANLEFGKVIAIKHNNIFVNAYDRILIIEEHSFKELPIIGEYL